MPVSLSAYLKARQALVDAALDRLLPKTSTKPRLLHRAMRYSVMAGGKRLRPILVMAAAEVCGGSARRVLPAACAMELIHTYSLVHDDLPAMDDDDLRRGRPTNHKVFGEDVAILAGDALLTHAFTLIAQNAQIRGIKASALVNTVDIISTAAGTLGMVGGQMADIQSDGGRWKRRGGEFSSASQLLTFIHMNKTAALIRASLETGACLAEGTPEQHRALTRYGNSIGLAFQIKDDILDRIGDKRKLGKEGSDVANKKLTFPALNGIESSVRTCDQLISQSHRALKIFGSKAFHLHALADFIASRDH